MKITWFTLLLLVLWSSKAGTTYVDSLKQELQQAKGLEQLNVLGQLSNYYASIDVDVSLTYDSLALDIATREQNLEAQSNILNNMGLSFYSKSDVATAIVLISESLELKEKIGDSLEIDKTLNNLGVLYRLIGDYESSIELLGRSLEIRRQRNDSLGIARTLSNTSDILNRIGRTGQALEMLEEARVIYTKMADNSGLASVYNNMGTVYQKTGDNEQAKEFFLLSIKMKCEEDDPRFTANTYNNLGMTSMALGNLTEAKDYYQKALNLRTKINDVFGLATVNVNLGELYLLKSEYEKSEQHLFLALEYAEKEMFKEPLQRIYYQLSQLFAATGRFENAFRYSEKSSSLNNELYNEELKKQANNLEMKLRTEIIYRENQMLKIDNRLKEMIIRRNQVSLLMSIVFSLFIIIVVIIIWARLKEKRRMNRQLENTICLLRNSEKKLKEANTAKDSFFSILAHDLTSPFNALLGFSDLLVSSYDDFDDEERKTFVYNIYKTSGETFKLLQNLLEYGNIQIGKISFEPENIDLAKLIKNDQELSSYIDNNKGIDVKINIPEGSIVYADKQMLKTIMRNLLSNAIKFTPKSGKVKLASETDNDHLLISVSDSGIGIPDEWQKSIFGINKEFKRKGTENERGTGLGLVLCAELVKKNKGKIWLESVENEGSTFYLALKKQQ